MASCDARVQHTGRVWDYRDYSPPRVHKSTRIYREWFPPRVHKSTRWRHRAADRLLEFIVKIKFWWLRNIECLQTQECPGAAFISLYGLTTPDLQRRINRSLSLTWFSYARLKGARLDGPEIRLCTAWWFKINWVTWFSNSTLDLCFLFYKVAFWNSPHSSLNSTWGIGVVTSDLSVLYACESQTEHSDG